MRYVIMKKSCVTALLLCCLLPGTAYAKDVYHESFTDGKTGRKIEYFDLNEDSTRPYFTQNMWFGDNNSFIVGGESDHQLYRYDVSNHTVQELFETTYLPIDNAAVVGPDDRVYARNSSDGHIYVKKVEPGVEVVTVAPLTMTLPLLNGYDSGGEREASGEEYTDPSGLTIGLTNNNRWDESLSVARERGGKWCRSTVARDTKSSGQQANWFDVYTWGNDKSYLRSTYLSFRVDSSKLSADTRNVIVEFDYYDLNDGALSGQYVQMDYLAYDESTGTSKKATKIITACGMSGTWKNVKVELTDACFNHSDKLQGGKNFDFRLYHVGNRGGLGVSNVKVYTASDVMDLGYAQGGWHPHVSNNGDLSLTTGSQGKIVIYESGNKKFATTNVWVNSTHAMINPVYPNLVLYSYDNTGDSNLNFDRIRLFNRNTMFKGCIFDQYSNSSNGATTGEAVGHESWTPDGEHIVAVKYQNDTNVGKSGIIRMDKDGKNREYINGDYNYWHCSASPDGRWIVADTVPVSEMVNIVLIDTKTGKSHLVARQQAFVDDPGQAHPSFNLDGTKITFAMARRKLNSSDEKYVIGVGIIDVSDMVNDGQISEPAAPTDYRISPFAITFNDTKNEVTTTVENIDGTKRAMNLYAAVYSGDKLISINKGSYDSSDDATLSAEIGNVNAGEKLKFFLWDGDLKPVKSATDTIKMLRVDKVASNGVVLSWQHDTDMPVLKYEVFRGEEKIGETPYTVFRDFGLTNETQYTYYVRPVYNAFHVGEDGTSITVNADELNLNGTNNQASGTSVAGSRAGVVASTTYKTVSADMAGNDITENGLSFVLNASETGKDGYTTKSDKGGKECRKITSDYSTSMCCFKLNKDIIPEDMTAFDITVGYYGQGSGKIQLMYTATDGTTKTVDVASLSMIGFSWKEATKTITDADFCAGLTRDSDFIIKATSTAYIRSVTVTPKSTSAITSQRQYVEWTTAEANGLVRTSGGTVDGDTVSLNGSEDYVKFSVDDTYMYGGGNNTAWVDITYEDKGTGNIYLYYNTSDPTAESKTADKCARDVITCTDTGELKTVRIPLIDAGFSNLDGYDFKIGTDSSAYISKVCVVGY